MQKQNVVLIPPSDEQAYASFHVTQEFAGAFLSHLAEHGIQVRGPLENLGHLGPQFQDVIEIELIDDTHPVSHLEEVVNDFLAAKAVENG